MKTYTDTPQDVSTRQFMATVQRIDAARRLVGAMRLFGLACLTIAAGWTLLQGFVWLVFSRWAWTLPVSAVVAMFVLISVAACMRSSQFSRERGDD